MLHDGRDETALHGVRMSELGGDAVLVPGLQHAHALACPGKQPRQVQPHKACAYHADVILNCALAAGVLPIRNSHVAYPKSVYRREGDKKEGSGNTPKPPSGTSLAPKP